MAREHELFGVEVGTATKSGGDYEIEEYETRAEAIERVAELAEEGRVTGRAAEGVEPGTEYAMACHLDATGCPTGYIYGAEA